MGERLLCKQEVTGSIPVGSTRSDRRTDDREQRADPLGSGFRGMKNEIGRGRCDKRLFSVL